MAFVPETLGVMHSATLYLVASPTSFHRGQPIWICENCMEAMISTVWDRPYVPGQELQAQESFHIRSLGVAAKNSLDLAGGG
ncbi:hypothetical protein ASPBRDRAFT_38819 [Aspergillus brasiliensis CBS 101740]|uniref:Uncharacterized protein n=1 Tax=Aspergillus brasiliensis (strain CBS 101740 / IMI 381727 / IBT 21946) TaxID=767769 RepID=A0A1L9UXD5_ASPBC|nr:hypothetical protein ASPBRDRAFT_38819 [Aspergillus brasiliensis CBS 101740]